MITSSSGFRAQSMAEKREEVHFEYDSMGFLESVRRGHWREKEIAS